MGLPRRLALARRHRGQRRHPETLFFNNCYWIYNLQTAGADRRRLGQHDAAGQYRQRAQSVRRAVHAKFFQPRTTAMSAACRPTWPSRWWSSCRPRTLRPAVWKRLEDEILVRRRGHIHAGITGGYFLVKNLVDGGRDDLIWTMATKGRLSRLGRHAPPGARLLGILGRRQFALAQFLPDMASGSSKGLGGIRPDPRGGGFQNFVYGRASRKDPSRPGVGACAVTSRSTARSPSAGRSRAKGSRCPSPAAQRDRHVFCRRGTPPRSASPAAPWASRPA